MAKYVVRYYDTAGDYSKCWVEVSSKKEAIKRAKEDYWDIDKISSVEKI